MGKKRKNLIGEELREYNKQQVMLAAIECIKYSGIYSTKVTDIAKKAGVTTRSVQRYYGDKEQLLLAAISYLVDKRYRMSVEFFQRFGKPHNTGYELVKLFFGVQKDFYQAEYLDYLAMNEIEIYFYRKGLDIEIIGKHLEQLRYIRRLLQKLIEIGQDDGSIRKAVDAKKTANMIESGFSGMMRRFSIIEASAMKYTMELNPEQQLEVAIEITLSYLRNDAV